MRAAWALLLLLPIAARADWPAGADVKPSVILDVTPSGFDAIEGLVANFVPSDFPVPGLSGEDYAGTGCLGGVFSIGAYYRYTIDNINLGIELLDIQLVPTDGALVLELEARIFPGRSDDRILVDYAAGLDLACNELGPEETCNIYVLPIDVSLSTAIELTLVPTATGKVLDVTIPDLAYDLVIRDSSLDSTGCIIGEIIEFIDDALSFFGFDGGLLGVIVDLLRPTLDEAIQGFVPDIEATLEEAFSALTIETELDLLGTPMALSIYPDQFEVTPEGLRLELAASADVGPSAECVAPYDNDLSHQTYYGFPVLGDGPVGMDHHLGAFINDDFANAVLYSLWRSGALCMAITAEESPVELPIPVDSSLLNLLAPGQYSEFFPETQPLILQARPKLPPLAWTDGDHTIDLDIDQFGLDLYSVIDGRMTRIIGLEMVAGAGVDVEFDEVSSILDVLVDFDPADIQIASVYNELKPETSSQIETGLASLVESIVGPLLSDALGGLTFPIPGFSGLGVTSLVITKAGPGEDFIGAFGTLGMLPEGAGAGCEGEDGGCGGDAGCGADPAAGCDSSTGSSCTTGQVPSRAALYLVPLLFAALRRRDRRRS